MVERLMRKQLDPKDVLTLLNCLQLNGINLFASEIILWTVQWLEDQYVGTIYAPNHSFKPLGIFKEVCCVFLCLTVRPPDVLRHQLFNQNFAQVFNHLENCAF